MNSEKLGFTNIFSMIGTLQKKVFHFKKMVKGFLSERCTEALSYTRMTGCTALHSAGRL